MSDSYQAIYDAVRSRISGGDINAAVENVIRDVNISYYAEQASCAVERAAAEYERPSAVFRPTLTQDGDTWIALYGPDLAVGVVGRGRTPAAAMIAFDLAWVTKAVVPPSPDGSVEGERA